MLREKVKVRRNTHTYGDNKTGYFEPVRTSRTRRACSAPRATRELVESASEAMSDGYKIRPSGRAPRRRLAEAPP